ncbi:NAD-dependent epimerase/dehydratase family protein [Jiangella asiatica]|uniref:NAD-dependent epimerase/dehydratase family protein n=1 Tax=Jiangella asiatica TaxID=2530372 RepID=A0A4R5CXX7_9ACTN|nr:NAD-dependent epimerase/dehydratase family protein [Jiangella asiatica]TDE02795.1 NAD-dependent epimerase/dehydratase family protein [Jiangella asiatica]
MRIVITGATGNIGTALLRRLMRAGGHQIVGLARRLPDDPEVVPGGEAVEWRAVDLSLDEAVHTLIEAFRGADAVVHLAWGFQPSHDLKYLEELGVGGTRRVLEAVTASAVPHLVHMSSVGAYSPKSDDVRVDESWPTGGVRSSRYSVHKAAAERLLDRHEATGHSTLISRMRPGIVGQKTAGSALLRYGVPAIVPAKVLDHIPVVPLDRGLRFPVVHADDVADAVVRELDRMVGGAFNLSAEPPITTDRIAEVLGARPIHVPSLVVRTVMSAAWHARLQQVDTGWLDMGFALPLLDCSRATRELGWSPSVDAVTVLREIIDGMRETAAAPTPALRRRSVSRALRDFVRRGSVGQRNRP